MLYKNDKPCDDQYEWQCDECGARSRIGPTPQDALFSGGVAGHFVDDSMAVIKTKDMCPECTRKYIEKQLPTAMKTLSGLLGGSSGVVAPDWVKKALEGDE